MKGKYLLLMVIIVITAIITTISIVRIIHHYNYNPAIYPGSGKDWRYIDKLNLPLPHKNRLKETLIKTVWETTLLEGSYIPKFDMDKTRKFIDEFYKNSQNLHQPLIKAIKKALFNGTGD